MNQFNKDIIAALSSDKDITLNEVLRRQIEVAANQFLVDGLVGLQSAIEANYPQAKFPFLHNILDTLL